MSGHSAPQPLSESAGCPFCDIVEGRAPARVVHRTPSTVAFLPDIPAVRGHTLIVPRDHVPDFLTADRPTAAAVALACAEVGRALKALLAPEGMNTISSAGQAATQSVFHWHVHVLPRWAGDRLGDFWPPDQPVPADELDEFAESLRQAVGS